MLKQITQFFLNNILPPNLHMKEVVKTKVFKLLDVGIIYPIFDSKWVSPTQVVPKKYGITVVKNEKKVN